MTFYTIKCPDCAARVRADTSQKTAECEYCGRLMLLNLEPAQFTPDKTYHQAGAKDQPQKDAKAQERIPSAREATLQRRLTNAQNSLLSLRKNRENLVGVKGRRKALIFPVGFALFLFFAVPASGSSIPVRIMGSLIIAGLAYLPVMVVRFFRLTALNRNIKQTQEECHALQAQLDELQDEAAGRKKDKQSKKKDAFSFAGDHKPRPIATQVKERVDDPAQQKNGWVPLARSLARGTVAMGVYAFLSKLFNRRKS